MAARHSVAAGGLTAIGVPVSAGPGADEPFVLEAILDGELVPGARAVLLCHPHPAFGGTLETPLVAALSTALAAAGVPALRFNFRGIGGSGGRASGGLFEEHDVAAACAWLRGAGAGAIAVAGYSFGALMAAKAIGRDLVAVERYVAIGLPTTILGDHADRIADVTRTLDHAPSFLLAGDEDRLCEIDRLRVWCAGRPRSELVVLDGQGHFFEGAALAEVVARAVGFLR